MKPYKKERFCTEADPAVVYVRVSTEEQARFGVSLEAQDSRTNSYCTMSGLPVVETVRDEGVSAAKAFSKRPGGMRVMDLLRSGQVRHIVALKLDRLFRDAEDALRQTKEWDRAGVALHLVDMGGQTLNTSTAMGRFFLNMLAAFAELERNMIAERTSTALQHKKASGAVYGPTPYGFDRSGPQLVPNPTEALIVQQVRRLRRDGMSFRCIADRLNAQSVATKRGKSVWYPSTVRYVWANDLYEKAA